MFKNRLPNRLAIFIIAILLGLTPAVHVRAQGTTETAGSIEVPTEVAAFSVRAIDGSQINIQPQGADGAHSPRVTVVCFLGNDCPMVKLYAPRLSQLSSQWPDQQVQVIGINSNPQDTTERIQRVVEELAITFPVIKDADQSLLRSFGATRTPEIFVLDSSLQIHYHGRVDDQYLPGIAKPKASRADLQQAVSELLQGQPVSVGETPFTGCLIGRLRETQTESTVTFANQVSRVLHQHCVECHREQDIAPFSLVDLEEVRGWSDMILEVVDDGRMPPWHAGPGPHEFVNARGLSAADKQILHDWVDAGMPAGDLAELPPPPAAASGWRLSREPDAVIAMSDQPFAVPAEGTVDYQYFVVDPGWTRDQWIVGVEVIPGNRSVVHHSIVFIRPPDGEQVAGMGWLGAYVPGQRPSPYPPGHGRFVPAGSKLVFQQHYTPNGRPQNDTTRVGLLFASEEQITHQVFTLMGINQEFEIPPMADNHPVLGQLNSLPKDAVVLGYSPHMHYRGKAFELMAVGDSQTESLLNVPRYDFNWQHFYELKTPVPLSNFRKLEFVARFDNSASNPANPDPQATVAWGDQSWEEMAVVFVEVASPRKSEVVSTPGLPVPTEVAKAAANDPFSPAEQAMAKQWVDEFIARFAKPGDDAVWETQLPEAIRRFANLDRDDDGRITRLELEPHARERFMWHEERQRERQGDQQ